MPMQGNHRWAKANAQSRRWALLPVSEPQLLHNIQRGGRSREGYQWNLRLTARNVVGAHELLPRKPWVCLRLPVKLIRSVWIRTVALRLSAWCIPTEWSERANYIKAGQIFHLAGYDVAQEIYGLPQQVSGLTSIWLNDDSTLFRRKYYRNGSHAGYLLYMNEPTMTKETENDIRAKLQAKEGMAFKNLFVNTPKRRSLSLLVRWKQRTHSKRWRTWRWMMFCRFTVYHWS